MPEGAVLIAGSGQSGTQLAEELYQSGRKVFLCVGKAGRLPRRYRGKDIIKWLDEMGIFNLTPEQLPPGVGKFRAIPQLTGKNGGYTINLHKFAKDGIKLLGRLKDVEGSKVFLAPDLYNSLAMVDQFEIEVVKMIDQYIQESKLNVPEEKLPELKDGYNQPMIDELNLKSENIKTIIWAGGYDRDFSFVKLPVFDSDRFPIQRRGVTNSPPVNCLSRNDGGIQWPGEIAVDEVDVTPLGYAPEQRTVGSDILQLVPADLRYLESRRG